MLDSYPKIYGENGRISEEYAYLEQIPNLIQGRDDWEEQIKLNLVD